MENINTQLNEAGAGPEDIVRLTWFIPDREAYLDSQREMGIAYRDVMGHNFPNMSVVQVVKLIEERAIVEIQATTVLPK